MTHMRPHSPTLSSAQRGVTLLELMIAILIGLFLTGALLTLVQAMKRTSMTQSGLSQLQDNERMAMTLIADVIQSAGYYPQPSPPVNTAATMFPIVAPFNLTGQTGQTIVGTGNWPDPPPGNTITVRYVTGGTGAPAFDNTINCTGNPVAAQTTFVNTFSLAADPAFPGTYDLVCVYNNAAPVVLVSGIANLQVYYGVQTNPTVSNNSADTYLDANTVTALSYWNKVISVKVTLSFVNPLGAAAPAIPFTRVIDIMNKAGVST
jgi:type IV pilus assembly protein PilW